MMTLDVWSEAVDVLPSDPTRASNAEAGMKKSLQPDFTESAVKQHAGEDLYRFAAIPELRQRTGRLIYLADSRSPE